MIYVSSACIKEQKIVGVLKKYTEAGIRNIELSGGTSFYPEIEQDLKEYGARSRINYACHSYFPPPKQDFVVNLAACNDEIYRRSIEHYKDCIKLLKRMDCKILSIHAGFYVEIAPKEIGKELSSDIVYDKVKALDRFCSAYEMLNRLCRDNGIKLYLENNVLNQGNYERFGKKNLLMLTDYETFEELRQQLEFELLLDLGHLHVSSNTLKKNYDKQCECFAPFAKWLHLSENNGVVDEHRPLCKESRIMRAYRNFFDRNVPVTLETNGSIQEILNSSRMVEDYING